MSGSFSVSASSWHMLGGPGVRLQEEKHHTWEIQRLGGAASPDCASQSSLAVSVANMVPTIHGHTLMLTLLLEGAS